MNRENIIRMAWKAGFERLGHTGNDWVCYPEDIDRFAALVASAEREACAQFIEHEYVRQFERPWRVDLSAAIRARGQA